MHNHYTIFAGHSYRLKRLKLEHENDAVKRLCALDGHSFGEEWTVMPLNFRSSFRIIIIPITNLFCFNTAAAVFVFLELLLYATKKNPTKVQARRKAPGLLKEDPVNECFSQFIT